MEYKNIRYCDLDKTISLKVCKEYTADILYKQVRTYTNGLKETTRGSGTTLFGTIYTITSWFLRKT